MRDEPRGLPQNVLARALYVQWNIDVQSLEYAPVGGGSYHWIAAEVSGKRWFVTADNLEPRGTQREGHADALFADLRAAYQTATKLREAGLSFVVSPVPSRANEVVERIRPGWAVALLPFIEGQPAGPGKWTDPTAGLAAARIIGELHRTLPPSTIQRWPFTIPHRGAFNAALRELDRPWDSGPYGERARQLIAESRSGTEALFNLYDELAEKVAASDEPWVVTHGEPHSANFISGHDGRLHLIDWDTVRLAPRERDLSEDAASLAAYQEIAGPYDLRPEAVELFQAWWTLAEICGYVEWFRNSHDGSLDDQMNWEIFTQYLPLSDG
jgi:spectinomycin phosphotransferase